MSLTEQEIPLLESKEKVKASRTKPDPRTFAQCRISIPEYEAALYVAEQAYQAGQIKAPTVSALTKACLITMINSFSMTLRHQNQVMETERKRKELLAITGPSRVPYTNPLKQYLKF
jgi:hypothetical protein